MNKVLAAELYKLRHSTVIWLMWFAGLITTVLYSVSAVTQASEYTWERWFMNYLTIFAVIGAALFSIIQATSSLENTRTRRSTTY